MYNWNKGKKDQTDTISSAGYIQNMEREMDELCEILSEETKAFKTKEFFDKIHEYIKKNHRLIYTHITNYIFTLSDEQFGTLQTNIDSVVNYMYGDQYEKDFAGNLKDSSQKSLLIRTQRTILKMWDHVNLARRQYVLFHHKDEDYTNIVDEKMEIASAKISKEMHGQLLALVSIFTALSFLLFGGMSSLDNIFIGARDIPILKLIIIGSIWFFCIMNMLFAFMYFVSKMTNFDFKATDDVNANIAKKYPLICWCNLVIISIFIFSSWVLYIEEQNLSSNLYLMIYENQTAFFVLGTIALLILFGYLVKKLYDIIKK